jgi:hypothetical protein
MNPAMAFSAFNDTTRLQIFEVIFEVREPDEKAHKNA